MLVGNGIRLLSGPYRSLGVTAPVYSTKMEAPYGAQKNFFIGEHASTSTRINGSQPSGVGHPYVWFWAQKPGGLASRNICEGTGTATGEIEIIASLSGDASGSCTVTGDLGLFISVSGDASGSCTVTGAATGTISVSGDVSVEGDTGFPTVDEISQAVMDQVIEAGYDVRDVLALLAARDLGESSGGPTSPAYKGLDGVTVRVTATVDSSGNRSDNVLTPG